MSANDDEYKIDEPIDKMAEDIRKTKVADITKDLLASELILCKDDLCVDNVFYIIDIFEKRGTCGLLPSVTCKRGCCNTCNIPTLYPNKSRMMLERVWKAEVHRHVTEVRSKDVELFDKLTDIVSKSEKGEDVPESLLEAFRKGLRGE